MCPRVAKRVVLSMGSLVLALAAVEVALRVLGLAPIVGSLRVGRERSAYRLSKNPVLGYELIPGFRDDRPDLHSSFPAVNSRGQRDVERAVAKPAGVCRILVVGDSVVAGHGIASLDDTISRQMERQYHDPRIEVLNLGVGGYCTRGEVELLEVKGVEYHPDVVVLVFVENDYFDGNSQVNQYEFERPAVVKELFLHSHLFRVIALAVDLYHFRDEVDPAYRRGWHAAAIGDDNVPRALQRFQDLARRHGFMPLIVLWPRFTEDRITYATPEAVHPERFGGQLPVEVMARSAGLTTYRIDGAFADDLAHRREAPSRAPGSPRDLYTIGDSMHPSPEGARVAAEAIRALLAKRGACATGR